jgi:hypothetical protein
LSSAGLPVRRIIEVKQKTIAEKANMSASNEPTDYMLLFRGKHWDRGLSPSELQQTIDRVMAWMEGLKEQGKVKAGQPLGPESKMVSGRNGRTVADGPFAESKEAVGGFLRLRRPRWTKRSRSPKRAQHWSMASRSKSALCSMNARFSNA